MNSSGIHNDLRVETTNRQILKIALPITLAMLVPQLNFVINTIFLSRLGETELGAAGITGVYYLVFALVGNGLNSSLQALIARRAGENRPGEIGRMFAQAIWIAMFFAFGGIILTYVAGPSFLSSSLTQGEVEKQARSFLFIRIWGLPFLYLFQLGNALLVGTNNSKYLKYGFAAQALFNILLDYLLIFGHFGFPKLGFNGAAIASVLAEAISVVIVFLIIFLRKFNSRFRLFDELRYNVKLAGLVFNQALPLVMQWLLSVGAWLLFYILIENSGSYLSGNPERPLAISNTMRNIFGVFGIFVWAFASTSNAMVSNIIGQGRKDEVLALITKIAKLSFLFTCVLCLLVNLGPRLFISIYGREEGFITEAIPVIRIVSAGLLVMSFATVWLNGVTGTANTRMNLLIEIVAISLYSIYIHLVLRVWHLSLTWAWASEILYWLTLFLLSWMYMRSGRWKSRNI